MKQVANSLKSCYRIHNYWNTYVLYRSGSWRISSPFPCFWVVLGLFNPVPRPCLGLCYGMEVSDLNFILSEENQH
jgi:hypothetical protein